jgi:trehalose 2-sulfotransferase
MSAHYRIPDYPAGIHETEILRMFGGLETVKAAIRTACTEETDSPEAPVSVIICFSNRSGSNFLAEGLRRTGAIGMGGELFNHEEVALRCSKFEIGTFDSYVRHIINVHAQQSRLFCTKVGWSQLYFLLKTGCIPQIIKNPRYLLIKRRDVLDQAISYSIAMQTKKWTSSHREQGIDPKFDDALIENCVHGTLMSHFHFEKLFGLNGQPFLEVHYEDLVADFQRQLKIICRWLGVRPKRYPIMEELRLQRQRNEVNEGFRARFLGSGG